MGKQRKESVHLGFNLSEEEREILEMYAKQENRTKTDVLRQMIRELKGKLKPEYKPSIASKI